jgi:putative DNA primase/helicase
MELTPFNIVIAEDQRQKDIDAALQQEAPSILHKMIAGCLERQRMGLQPPEAVVKASKDYMDAEDNLQLWFDDCVTVERGAEGAFTQELYHSYSKWMERNGHSWPLTANAFTEELDRRAKDLGIKREPEKFIIGQRRGRGFRGIKSLASEPLAVHWPPSLTNVPGDPIYSS